MEPFDPMTADLTRLSRRHLRFGWWSLVFFLSTGIALEALHGLKLGYYLDVGNETRRLLWTLGHAHGTLLALINIVFGLMLRLDPDPHRPRALRASRCLIPAAVLLPAGFFLGGLFVFGGDPGIGILLVPVGALLLLAGVVLAARGASASRPGGE